MPYSVEGKLVVAISSRALFDFEEENRVFDAQGERAYIDLQYSRMDVPAKEGVAFRLVKKLLAFNSGEAQRVEVVILSKNDPVSGLRIFRSAERAGLKLERGVFTRGRNPYRYLDSLKANLFLSANENDVKSALEAQCPAARVVPESAQAAGRHADEVRIAHGEHHLDASVEVAGHEVGAAEEDLLVATVPEPEDAAVLEEAPDHRDHADRLRDSGDPRP